MLDKLFGFAKGLREVNAGQDVVRTGRIVSSRSKWGLAFVLFVLVYMIDQGSKWLVEHAMTLGQRIEVIPGVFRWFYILNPGAAFSFGEGHTWVFTVIQAVAAVIVVTALMRARSLWWVVSLACLLGGILGNLTDRLFRAPGFAIGHVVDFISVGNFAIFNIADSAICLAMAAIIIMTVAGLKLDGTFEKSASTSEEK